MKSATMTDNFRGFTQSPLWIRQWRMRVL